MYFLLDEPTNDDYTKILAKSHDGEAIQDLHLNFQRVGQYGLLFVRSADEEQTEEPVEEQEQEDTSGENNQQEQGVLILCDEPIEATLDPEITAHQQFNIQKRYCKKEVEFIISTLSCSYDLEDATYLLNQALAEL